MPSLAELATRCEQIGGQVSRGQLTRQEVLDATTSLLLIVNMLDRLLSGEPMDRNALDSDRVTADLARAREALRGIEAVAQTASEDELLQDVLRAQTSAMDAFRILLAGKGA